jgi:hypothetical protein
MTNRTVSVVTSAGVRWLELDDEERSIAAGHDNAVKKFKADGSTAKLAQYRGTSVGGYELETDPDELQYLANRGKLDFEEFYDND